MIWPWMERGIWLFLQRATGQLRLVAEKWPRIVSSHHAGTAMILSRLDSGRIVCVSRS